MTLERQVRQAISDGISAEEDAKAITERVMNVFSKEMLKQELNYQKRQPGQI